ncbi:hypothetical protein AMTRI_Chr11g100790 [Amborella trichopoda]
MMGLPVTSPRSHVATEQKTPMSNVGRKSFNSRVSVHRKSWVSRSFYLLMVIFSVVSTYIILGQDYIHVFPTIGQKSLDGIFGYWASNKSCNVFSGSWVIDQSYPLYNSSLCPFVERGFNCERNGRPDNEYMKIRWQPHNCDIPRFDVQSVLQRLRGLRIVFVGDSMGRTQWESLICLLMTGVEDKRSVYEVNGNKITKQIRFLGVRFRSHNITLEYFRSPFLVQRSSPPKNAPKRVKSTVKLDRLDSISKRWIQSDFLIFNSGQWWTHMKTFDVGNYFQVGDTLKLGMPITTAFQTAITTWASWAKENINMNRTHVFFRTFETSHWRDVASERSCRLTSYPMSGTEGLDQNPFASIVREVVYGMKAPVKLLDITYMSALRCDAHLGKWSDTPSVPDCSHWCLPGVPDAWNELLLTLTAPKNGTQPA